MISDFGLCKKLKVRKFKSFWIFIAWLKFTTWQIIYTKIFYSLSTSNTWRRFGFLKKMVKMERIGTWNLLLKKIIKRTCYRIIWRILFALRLQMWTRTTPTGWFQSTLWIICKNRSKQKQFRSIFTLWFESRNISMEWFLWVNGRNIFVFSCSRYLQMITITIIL